MFYFMQFLPLAFILIPTTILILKFKENNFVLLTITFSSIYLVGITSTVIMFVIPFSLLILGLSVQRLKDILQRPASL